MKSMRRCPAVLGDMDEVEQDVEADAASGGFGLDQVKLVAGAVNN